MRVRLYFTGALVAATLAGCSGGEPKGQVVAKVGKEEVTLRDLQAELGGFKAPDAKTRKLAEQQALNQIIVRKIVANAALEQKLDKTPEYVLQERRMIEDLLARSLQDRYVKAVPAASADEATNFVASHPDLYSARKIFGLNSLRFAVPADRSVVEALRPLNTLPEVEAELTSRKIPFQVGAIELDALQVDPRMTDQLLKLKSGEVFVVPQGNLILVGQIREMKTQPVAANIAMQHAANYLKSLRTQESLQRSFGQLVAQGRKDVTYNKAYEPPKPASAAKGTTPMATPPAQKGATPVPMAPAAKPG